MTYTGTLTEEQLAAVHATRDDWMRIGLSTERCDRDAAEIAVRALYREHGLAEPRQVIWMDSPLGGLYACSSRDQLGGQLRDQLWGQLGDQLGDQLWGQLRDQLWGQLRDQLRGQLGDQLWGQLGDQLWDQLGDQLYKHMSGWRDAYWIALYAHALPIGGLSGSRKLDLLAEVCRNAGWWWPYSGAVILTDRPVALHRDPQGRLHRENGPALAYADGYGLWSWHGTRVPQDLIETGWTPAQILAEPNAEIRRCAVERIGWDRYIAEAGLIQVGCTADDPGNPGQTLTLYDVPEQVFEAPVRVLLCTNGTTERDGTRRRFGLTTPAGIGDPLAAAAWTYNDEDHPVRVNSTTYAALQRRC